MYFLAEQSKMSACSNFIEHLWIKDKCRNCSQHREDHSCQQHTPSVSPVTDTAPPKLQLPVKKKNLTGPNISLSVTPTPEVPQPTSIALDLKDASGKVSASIQMNSDLHEADVFSSV